MNKTLIGLVALCALANAQPGSAAPHGRGRMVELPQPDLIKNPGNRASFDKADTNQDGVLTADELAAALGGDRNRASTELLRYDHDHDGRISAEEWVNGPREPAGQ